MRNSIFYTNTNNSNKQMKKTYLMPTVELDEFVVEDGIAVSPWGDAGAAGQEGLYWDYLDENGEIIEL